MRSYIISTTDGMIRVAEETGRYRGVPRPTWMTPKVPERGLKVGENVEWNVIAGGRMRRLGGQIASIIELDDEDLTWVRRVDTLLWGRDGRLVATR